MNKILLFDLDGTLAESGQCLDSEIINLLWNLKNDYHLGIVGGGRYEKIIEQVNEKKLFDYIFSECGCVYHKLSDYKYEKIKEKNIRDHELYPKINVLIKTALLFISNVDYTITGHFIDLRIGIIYISLIGMNANQNEREYFINLDNNLGLRQELLTILNNKSKELGIQDRIKILEGGSVGIGIYPSECGKIQVLDYLTQYSDISYFGDKYTKNGNDYDIITSTKIKGYPVNGVDDTKKILFELVKKSNF